MELKAVRSMTSKPALKRRRPCQGPFNPRIELVAGRDTLLRVVVNRGAYLKHIQELLGGPTGLLKG